MKKEVIKTKENEKKNKLPLIIGVIVLIIVVGIIGFIILNQNNNSIKKDKFSAFEYGLYYAKLDEERKRKRKSHSIADMMFFS